MSNHPQFIVTDRLKDRFFAKCHKLESCWIWNGAWSGVGYGKFKVDGKAIDAHVVSWRIANGGIAVPAKMMVMHSCDVRPCVNPGHLSIGTRSDNMKDARDKGRLQESWQCGEKAHNAVLNADLVREIRRLYVPRKFGYAKIAAQLGISKWAVKGVISKKTWRHVK